MDSPESSQTSTSTSETDQCSCRRRLQFEDDEHKAISNRPAQNPSYNVGLKSLSLETPTMPINDKHSKVIQPMSYLRNSLNSTIKIPKLPGIGLHLNSIINVVQDGHGGTTNMKSARWGKFSILGNKSTPMTNSNLSDYSNNFSRFSPAENVSESADDNMHESYASVAANSAMSLSTHIVKPSNNTVVLNSVVDQSTPDNKRKCTEKDRGGEESNKCPQKKSGNGGWKCCNCKKSKCLKLYCDCFAAGVYCAKFCACQECFNTPQYMDAVLEKKQKIESQDPLAFAPRVVQHTDHPEDGTLVTPFLARHKRGCNCKKCMCLQKYCGCYQAKVGCSYGCQCEDCKNVYGQKGDKKYGMIKDLLSEDDTNETTETGGSLVPKCEMTASGTGAYHPELPNPHNLTPMTSAFQFSNWTEVPQEVEMAQDDTPEILKETSRPLNAVTVSSRSKKRVSPPHGPADKFGSSSSATGFIPGRKFILKSAPSLPPLTSCIDPKTADQKANDPQNRNANNGQNL